MKRKKTKTVQKTVAAFAAVVVIGLAAFAIKSEVTGNKDSQDSEGITLHENGDIGIDTAQITENASFYETKVGDTTVGILAVKASDGSIRTAFNTCQVCNGSPYAYFEQQGDSIQCQNCKNIFALDQIGMEQGGCNPVPISETQRTEKDGEITIPSTLLSENAPRFLNWKQY